MPLVSEYPTVWLCRHTHTTHYSVCLLLDKHKQFPREQRTRSHQIVVRSRVVDISLPTHSANDGDGTTPALIVTECECHNAQGLEERHNGGRHELEQ